MITRMTSAAIAVVSACGTLATAQSIPLDFNWNGAVHPGEGGNPDAAAGYRSISDRGWQLGASDSLGGTGYAVSLNNGGRVYDLPSAAGVPDVVFVGARDQNGGAWDGSADGDDIGVQPTWDPSAGTLSVPAATSTFAPIPLTADDAIGFLFQASNGGGDFDVELGFTDGTSVTVTINAPDWFANNNPGSGSQEAGIAAQVALGGPLSGGDGFLGTETVDVANPGAPLNAIEAVITQDSLLAGLGFDWTGKSLDSITFSSPLPGQNTRVIVIAASIFDEDAVVEIVPPLPRIGILTPPDITLPTRSPNLVDSDGLDFFGLEPLGPGEFPDVLVVGKWEVAVATTPVSEGGLGQSTYTLDTADSEYIMASRILSGPAPFYWTGGASNEGDIDINIGGNTEVLARQGGVFAQPLGTSWNQTAMFGPADRMPIEAFSSNGFRFENLGNAGPDVGLAEPNYAWSVGLEAGVPIFGVAENGVENGQVDPVVGALPTLYGTTGTSFGGRRGKGYSLVDGFVAGIGGGETGARTTVYAPFGAAGAVQEFAFDTSCWYFPFAGGWAAGAFTNDGWRTEDGGSIILRSPLLGADGLDPDEYSNVVEILEPGKAYGTLTLPGVRSPENGMVFLTSSRGNNRTIFNVAEQAGGWLFLGHPDENIFGTDADPLVNDGTDPNTWANTDTILFTYVGYDQPNVVGGKVAANGTVEAGTDGFAVTRLGTGRYEIDIAGDSGTTEDGAMLLQGLASLPADPALPGRTFFSYEYQNGVYVVEAREAVLDVVSGDGNFESFPLVDAPFYVLYSNFVATPAASLADIDGSGTLEAGDLGAGLAGIDAGWLEITNDGAINFFDVLRLTEAFDEGF